VRYLLLMLMLAVVVPTADGIVGTESAGAR
jgi:hypothetical protein